MNMEMLLYYVLGITLIVLCIVLFVVDIYLKKSLKKTIKELMETMSEDEESLEFDEDISDSALAGGQIFEPNAGANNLTEQEVDVGSGDRTEIFIPDAYDRYLMVKIVNGDNEGICGIFRKRCEWLKENFTVNLSDGSKEFACLSCARKTLFPTNLSPAFPTMDLKESYLQGQLTKCKDIIQEAQATLSPSSSSTAIAAGVKDRWQECPIPGKSLKCLPG